MRDNFNMENTRHNTSSDYETKKVFLKLSRFGFLMLLAIFLCSLIAVALLVYNFAVCPPEEHVHLCRSRLDLLNDDKSLISTAATDNSNDNPAILKDVRLPRSITPISYDIVIVPYLSGENFTFDGDVIIKMQVLETCKNISLHSFMLKIHRNITSIHKVTANESQSLTIKNQYFIEAKQFLVIETEEELERGEIYQLKISYIGQIRDNLQGFYKSSYTVNNETKWIASTQFQATDARRAFPCFDEPEYKATFKLTLGRPITMITLSNMPLETTETSVDRAKVVDDYVYDIYPESIRMSTYLVAFVVCDFVNISNAKENFAVWARPDAIQSTHYALSIGPKIIKFLNEFFDIKYPLPKMDLIAVPDFLFGAMENFGLITFRETAMLYDAGVSPISKKMTVASVVAHECAHQWFGNLITNLWWSDLWLNEGFATYMEHIIVNHIEPTWRSKDLFVAYELHPVFAFDALVSSHKISIEVQNPEQINEIFDFISYSKGASLIRSMENFLTLDVFKRGLSTYVKKFAYKSATQDDLWNELTIEAHKSESLSAEMSVKEIMDTWTLQTGLPYITVTRNYKDKEIQIEQKRFILIETNSSDAAKPDSEKDPLWWVPITFTKSTDLNFNETKPSHWMKATKSLKIEEEIENSEWILFNLQVAHYYRVNYDLKNWKLITNYLNDPLKFSDIPPANRAQLINDAMNLARADILDYTVALDVTKYLRHETEYVPWKTAISDLFYIDSMLIRSSDYHLMKRYFTTRIEVIYGNVGFEDQGDELTMLTRFEVLKVACHLGIKDCVNKAIGEFFKWTLEANPDINNPVSPNLKSIVYCTAIKYGGQDEFDFAWDRYLNTSMSSEKELLMNAMGCSREHWILNRYLNRSISSDGIRKQDTFRVFSAVSGNVWGQPVAFHFIMDNWKQIRQYFGANSPISTINSIIKSVTRRLTDKSQLEELKKFTDKDLKEGRTMKQAIETGEANISWLNKNQEKIFKWLRENLD